ncbi:MAG: lysophospholipid acyltransferase family protein [Planctomycetota bacterium]|nr:lysophospholipid acyltransferase family protein [Planctomycetota bacterium]
MFWLLLIPATLAALVVLGLFARWVMDNPRGEDDVVFGIAYRATQIYARVVHRLDVAGAEHVPASRAPGPLIVVCNHTAGIDPIMIQAACPFEIRWMMAEDMRSPLLEPMWQWLRIIDVDPGGSDSRALREAIRHLEAGGVIGLFPEGGLERPPRRIRPFHPGLGFLVRKAGARVLPMVIDGTPQVDPAWASLWKSSETSLRVLPVMDFSQARLKPQEITDQLRARFMEWTGWVGNDDPGPPPAIPEGAFLSRAILSGAPGSERRLRTGA